MYNVRIDPRISNNGRDSPKMKSYDNSGIKLVANSYFGKSLVCKIILG